MGKSDKDRLYESRVLGTLAGMTAGIALWVYFMEEIFEVTQQTRLFGYNIIGGVLVLGILACAIGAGGIVGRAVGEHVIYPIRTGNDAPAIRMMLWLILGGIAVTFIVTLVVVVWQIVLVALARG